MVAGEGLDEVLADFRRAGWRVHEGWHPPAAEWSLGERQIVCTGCVASSADVAGALIVAARGAGIVARVDALSDVVEPFLEDLRRIGTVEYRVAEALLPPVLADDEQRLLNLLSAGATVAEAARVLFISRRTAVRRLASARRRLGVETNAEAVHLAADAATRLR